MRACSCRTASAVASPPIEPLVLQNDEDDYFRLGRQVLTAVAALPAQLDGRDAEIEEYAEYHRLRRSDAVILPILFRSRRIILLVARSQAWRNSKAALIETKRAAAHARRRLLLVPAGRVRRPIFLANCALLSLSKSTKLTATLRMAVVEQLQTDPTSSLRDCAERITNHDDPFGAILAMVAEGLLRIDLQHPITPESGVALA